MATARHGTLKRYALPLGVVAFVGLMPFLSRVNPHEYDAARSRDVRARAVRNTSAAAIMLGEVRTAVSDIMFIKTERYLHSGVAYVPHMEDQIMSVSGAERLEALDEEDEAGEEIKTVISTRTRDFRGFIGDFHRAVKPWVDPSTGHAQHTSGTELLPWFRVMTLSDPHFVRGYAVGGWWLKAHKPDAAIGFLEEGIANNPDALQIRHTMGLVLKAKADAVAASGPEHAAHAEEYYRRAGASFKAAADLAVAQRPPAWTPETPSASWSRYIEDDAFAAARLAVLLEREHGDPGEAAAMARGYLERLGPDTHLERLTTPTAP